MIDCEKELLWHIHIFYKYENNRSKDFKSLRRTFQVRIGQNQIVHLDYVHQENQINEI